MPKKSKNTSSPIPKDLFDILACPLCGADLEYSKGRKGLLCQNCGAKYQINDGIPVMLPSGDEKSQANNSYPENNL